MYCTAPRCLLYRTDVRVPAYCFNTRVKRMAVDDATLGISRRCVLRRTLWVARQPRQLYRDLLRAFITSRNLLILSARDVAAHHHGMFAAPVAVPTSLLRPGPVP